MTLYRGKPVTVTANGFDHTNIARSFTFTEKEEA